MVTLISRISICLALAVVVVRPFSCRRDDPPLTVDGPEADELASRVNGNLIVGDLDVISAVSLPSLEERVVYPLEWKGDGNFHVIHALSGPDRHGRIAYLEDHLSVENEEDQRHLLKTVRMDGTEDTEIFSRPGAAEHATTADGKRVIGWQLALAPTGGRVAFLSEISKIEESRTSLPVGRIEIWNVVEKVGGKTTVEAIEQPMSWFPDGKRLAYTKLVPRTELPQPAPGFDHFGASFNQTWDEIPAIFVYDTESGTSSFLYVGWEAIVSQDGNSVFVGAWVKQGFQCRRVNVQTSQSQPVTLPGVAGNLTGVAGHLPGATTHLIAAPSEDVVLYWGLPTTGTTIKHLRLRRAFVGPDIFLSIKVTHAETGAFQTIVPYIHPGRFVSFGPGGPKE